MKSTIRLVLLGLNVLLVLAIATTVYNSQFLLNNNSIMVYAQQIMGMPPGGMGMEQQQPGPGQYAGGTISSIQNDENGTPAWILSGLWKGALTNTADKSNQDFSTPTVSNNNDNLPTATFEAEFDMVMLNGSALHQHSIYNFTLVDIMKIDDEDYQVNGTATVTMVEDGPVNNVPLSIKAMNNNVISILVDPTKVNNHFGNTPIFGLIQQDIVIKK
ncbi:MAG TPA: hypothetical protein VFR65_03400 [Nitrososphaeraceae archaeon]|nr:hypothetical protein [Nitrososphaeraceae archaeon]